MKQKFDYLILFLLTFVAHGLLLISDGIFWDDWLWYTSLSSNDYFLINRVAFERGIPTDYYFWLSFTILPDVILSQRLIVFSSILLSAFIVYEICLEYGKISRTESLMITAVFISYPAFETWVLISTSQYVFYYFIFLLATLITLKMRSYARLKATWFRFLSLILFFLSFSLNSLLVFYFGFLILLFIVYLERGFTSKKGAISQFVVHHIDYLLIPFVYWFVKKFFFPQYGFYTDYNNISLSFSSAAIFASFFILNGVVYQITSAVSQVFNYPVLWLFLPFSMIVIPRSFEIQKVSVYINRYNQLALFLFGIILLLMGMVPYILAGHYPNLHGWNTRHMLLLALPVGIILVTNICFIFAKPGGMLHWSGWLLFLTLLIGFNALTINQYIGWQQRWIKDRSVMEKLENMDEEQMYSIFWVEDQFPLVGDEFYQYYEWSSMFKKVWRGERWVGLPLNLYADWIITDGTLDKFRSYNYNNLDVFGCHAVLIIKPGTRMLDSPSTLLYYYYYRFVIPSRMEGFLESITQVKVKPLQSVLATNCRK